MLTADSDLVPAVALVKNLYPQKQVFLVTPIGRRAQTLKAVCDKRIRLKLRHLQSSQLPDAVTLADGSVASRPIEWI